MMRRFGWRAALVAAAGMLFAHLAPAAIPDEVDVVVAGGTTDGVRAALRAKSEGKRVFVAAPRPYLGEDRAATYRLEKTAADDPRDALVRAMFDPATRADAAWLMPEDQLGVGLAYQLAVALDKKPMTPDKDGLLPVTTPLEVKRALDRALLDAKVPFLAPEGSVPEIPNYSNAASNAERSDCLRELCLARALFRLGDCSDGLGRRTLAAYARDPRGALAKHAGLVLLDHGSPQHLP